jgi:3-oxoacyl-[acyl-carrier protein] reductase
MDLGLAGRACVVTGASRGIGRATARLLADEGASVLLVARSQEDLQQAADELTGAGDRHATLALDVTADDAGERIMAECVERFGGLWALVNNAGTSEVAPLEEQTDEQWQAQWELHVMASLRTMRAAVPRMKEHGGGRIVNVASSAGKRPSLTNAAYSVTKAAQLSLSRVFADSYAGDGILVNAVAPGAVESSLWVGEGGLADQVAEARGGTRDDALKAQQDKIPLGRFGTEDEIAGVVVFLCSTRASDVTGASWSVDGGTVPLFI